MYRAEHPRAMLERMFATRKRSVATRRTQRSPLAALVEGGRQRRAVAASALSDVGSRCLADDALEHLERRSLG